MVSPEVVYLRRPIEPFIDNHPVLPVQLELREGQVDQILHAVSLSGGYYVVVRPVLLKHQPHGLNIVAGIPPVSSCFKVSNPQLFRQSQLDPCCGMTDFSAHKFKTSPGGLMVEKNPAHCINTVGFTVVPGKVEPAELRYPVRRPREKRGMLVLR